MNKMKFSNQEIESGFKAFFQLVTSNKNKTFQVEMPYGDILNLKYDMDFEDDSSSTDDDISQNDLDEFNTISFFIIKVVDNLTKEYKKGNIILINYRNLPTSYKIID
jgi:hypothetical protein